MVADWIITVIIALTINVVSALLAPRPKQPAPEAVQELEAPTAEAGRVIQKVFGRKIIKDPNIVWYGDISTNRYRVRV
jgi:hypothetical protein